MSFFDAAFEVVVDIEKGFQKDESDPGNWTGGEKGKGVLKGTKYGISAKSYPTLDIENLTLDQAKDIFWRDYWNVCGCELYPWNRALCIFDMSVNQGAGEARLFNLHYPDPIEFMTQRALRYTRTPGFETDGHGWLERLFTVFKKAQVIPNG